MVASISSRDGDGDENTVLVRIDPATGEKRDLTPGNQVSYLVGADREVLQSSLWDSTTVIPATTISM